MGKPETLGTRLRAFRIGRRLTLREVGEAMGVTASAVSKWESSASQLQGDDVPKLADVLGVRASELYGESESHPPSNVVDLREVRAGSVQEIAVYAWGSCGPLEGDGAVAPVDFDPWPEDIENLPADALAVRVRGRSMTGRGIEPGSTCYVAPDRPLSGATDVVLARAWALDNAEVGMVVKVLGDGGKALYSDGDDGLELYPTAHFDVIGPVLWHRTPAQRPRTARESTRRRPDMRSGGERMGKAIDALKELSPEQRRLVFDELGGMEGWT